MSFKCKHTMHARKLFSDHIACMKIVRTHGNRKMLVWNWRPIPRNRKAVEHGMLLALFQNISFLFHTHWTFFLETQLTPWIINLYCLEQTLGTYQPGINIVIEVNICSIIIYQEWPNLLYVWAAYRKSQVTKSRNKKRKNTNLFAIYAFVTS